MHHLSWRKRPDRIAGLIAGLLLAHVAVPGHAQISTTGDVFPNPVSGTVNGLVQVGSPNAGLLSVTGGSSLTAYGLTLGSQSVTSAGTALFSGSGTVVNLTGPVNSSIVNPLGVGILAPGYLEVSSGATVNVANPSNPNCVSTNCNVFIGGAAGGTGTMVVTGNGSRVDVGNLGFFVGSAAVVVQSLGGFDLGIPGGTATGILRIEDGGVLNTRNGQLSLGPQGANPTGSERSVASVTVDGAGSAWNIARSAAVSGTASLLTPSSGPNSTSTVQVRNGGRITIDGSAGGGQFTGMNMATGGPTSAATLSVDGSGSLLEFAGGTGFLNVGTHFGTGLGGSATLEITGGGRVSGTGANGLPFVAVGRAGAAGLLRVDGADGSGIASLLRIAGKYAPAAAPANNPANLAIARDGGTGTAIVSGGGRIEIDARGVDAGSAPFLNIGLGANSVGSMTITGTNAATSSASTVIVQSDRFNPFVGVGRAGGIGTLNVLAGGRLELNGTGASLPGVANQNSSTLSIGTADAPGYAQSTGIGTVNVSGAGSAIAMTGTGDSLFQVGVGTGGIGNLNVTNGGTISGLTALVGNQGGIGTVNVANANVAFSGTAAGGFLPGAGAGWFIGRGTGVGTVNVSSGSTFSIASSGEAPTIAVGGTLSVAGGTGSFNVSGGSSVNVSGDRARIMVGYTGDATNRGIGNMTVVGAGTTVSVSGADAKVVVGNAPNTVGTLVVGQGAALNAGTFLGVAHAGTAGSSSSGGSGTLTVNGSVSAASIVVGSSGYVSGSGTLVGDVTNYGVINPGNSPGRLIIDGAFTGAAGGKLILEVLQQGTGFLTDELVFTDPGALDLGNTEVVFSFLQGTDPGAFQTAGLFNLDQFFFVQGLGGTTGITAFLGQQAVNSLFSDVVFEAQSTSYVISNFAFSPESGASFQVEPIPEPSTYALMVTGLALLGWMARKRKVLIT